MATATTLPTEQAQAPSVPLPSGIHTTRGVCVSPEDIKRMFIAERDEYSVLAAKYARNGNHRLMTAYNQHAVCMENLASDHMLCLAFSVLYNRTRF